MQEVLKSWQEYRDEERRLSKWLKEKESQIEDIKHIDLGDSDVVKKTVKILMVSIMCVVGVTFLLFKICSMPSCCGFSVSSIQCDPSMIHGFDFNLEVCDSVAMVLLKFGSI